MSNLSETTPAPGPRLDHLDGLRGLCALYVVLYHCRSEFTWQHADGGFSPWMRQATAWMNFGHYAVVVFIVLSGYCLMLPVVRSQNGALAGGLGGYLKRRARRTLPAYYGAITFSLLLIALIPGLRHPADAQWDRCLPAFRSDMLWSHLLMIHNLRREWYQTIDGPLWSMATEWDVYLAFALLLLPLWRWGGTILVTGAATLLGQMPHLLLPPVNNFDWACPWFLGCFALGMAGAAVNFSEASPETRWRTRIPWPGWTVLFGAGAVLIWRLAPAWADAHWADMDPLIAGVTACALVSATNQAAGTGRCLTANALRVLTSRPLRILGAFSYSLYLTHYPLLALFHVLVRHWGLRPDAAFPCLTALAVPTTLLTAFLFARMFERPVQRTNRHTLQERHTAPGLPTKEKAA